MDVIEQRIVQIIEDHATQLQELCDDIFCHAEQGFHEFRTAKIAADFFKKLNLPVREGLAVTGVKAICGNGKGPNVALLGELDGIRCPDHPKATELGYAHACGHYAQLVSILGAALALSDPEVQKTLDGTVTFFAVPAEETLDTVSRKDVEEQYGVLHHGGKRELIARGEFNDIDVAVTDHSHLLLRDGDNDLMLGSSPTNGFISKTVRIHGKAAHAALAPHEGTNALNAATLALSAIGMLRETFQEKDFVRIHYVFRKGGDAVNVIPSEVELSLMVRASNIEAMEAASKKVDRAFQGTAMAIGATCEIENEKGYLPTPERTPHRVLLEAAAPLQELGHKIEPVPLHTMDTASTDVGDLATVRPVLTFTFGGSRGTLHSAQYRVTDPHTANILPAEMMALTAYHLLKDGAAGAREVQKDFVPAMTVEDYLIYVESEN